MPAQRNRSRRHAAIAALLASSTLVTVTARDARADEVSPTAKGVVGGGLLGAEAVTIVEALAGVRPGWAYAVGAVVGGAGGAIGGHFVEDGSSDGRLPMYMLAGGLALVIPAIVLTLNATRYMPEEGATEDNAPIGPAAEPGAPGGSIINAPNAPPPTTSPGLPAPALPPPPPAPPAPTPAPVPPPQSLFDMHQGTFRLGIPVPDVRPVFTLHEQRQYGMRAETELRMPMLHMVF
jgi:hypothetical protein